MHQQDIRTAGQLDRESDALAAQLYKDDGGEIIFTNPKVLANVASNTYVIEVWPFSR